MLSVVAVSELEDDRLNRNVRDLCLNGDDEEEDGGGIEAVEAVEAVEEDVLLLLSLLLWLLLWLMLWLLLTF